MSDENPLLVTRQGPVVRAVMNRPHRKNAISTAMGHAWDALLAELARDETARVLVISGAGGAFCAGLDLTEVGAPVAETGKRAREHERNRAIGARYAAISALPQVVIAAVEGPCYAGGLGFVGAADIAFAVPSARFSMPEPRVGLVPAQILPWVARRVGRMAAGRMALEAAPIDGLEAARLGLVNETLPNTAAMEAAVAASIANLMKGAPRALAGTKALLAALGPLAPEGYAAAGAELFAKAAAGPEAAEGIAAFREKRPPSWAG
ncbi:enoyl-CoA hydratase/isomerase family protein [Acetobacteraceae bacterium H6797]|nr:enoyl-CoA hydratase/isomerase family protein [Acetobacteraceae bacterium H6797]